MNAPEPVAWYNACGDTVVVRVIAEGQELVHRPQGSDVAYHDTSISIQTVSGGKLDRLSADDAVSLSGALQQAAAKMRQLQPD